MSGALEFKAVTKRFENIEALSGLDLTVARGEVYGLLGPNGSGKTTAIRILCGLERASSGEAFVLGERVPNRAVASRMGYMPQETALYADITVRENLELFGALYGVEGEAFEKRFETLVKLVDLKGREESVVSTLSGGMRHRTSLIAAMVHDPELLVLDEPTVGVDPELRASFWKHFDDLAAAGRTILITTHYMDEARRCGRVGLLQRGRLIAQGTPSEILAQSGTTDLEDAFLHFARRVSA